MFPSWRFPAGVAIFALGFCAPLAIPLVTASDLPPGWKAVISGALAVGVPEVMMLVAAAVMGKEGFAAWAQLAKPIHDYLALPFAAGLFLLLLMWIGKNGLKSYDFEWLKSAGGAIGGGRHLVGELLDGDHGAGRQPPAGRRVAALSSPSIVVRPVHSSPVGNGLHARREDTRPGGGGKTGS